MDIAAIENHDDLAENDGREENVASACAMEVLVPQSSHLDVSSNYLPSLSTRGVRKRRKP